MYLKVHNPLGERASDHHHRTRSHAGVNDYLMGSVAERVMRVRSNSDSSGVALPVAPLGVTRTAIRWYTASIVHVSPAVSTEHGRATELSY